MKDFKLVYEDELGNGKISKCHNAIDIVRIIKDKKLSSYEISYYIPFYREYNHIITVDNGKKTEENESIKIPYVFRSLGK